MKKILNVLLIAGTLALASCSGPKVVYTQKTEPKTEKVTVVTYKSNSLKHSCTSGSCVDPQGNQSGGYVTDPQAGNNPTTNWSNGRNNQWVVYSNASVQGNQNNIQWNNQQGGNQQLNNQQQSPPAGNSDDTVWAPRTSKDSNSKGPRRP